mgnify:CR=1 FL=1
MDLLVKDESPSQISDKIKDVLFAKTADKVSAIRPVVAASVFDKPEEVETDIEASAEPEVEQEYSEEE